MSPTENRRELLLEPTESVGNSGWSPTEKRREQWRWLFVGVLFAAEEVVAELVDSDFELAPLAVSTAFFGFELPLAFTLFFLALALL